MGRHAKRTKLRTADRPPRTASRAWWPLIAIVIATIVVYAGSLSAPFIFDDRGAIELNTCFQYWPDIPKILALMPPETPFSGRPLVGLTFALNYGIDGLNVRGYRAVNLVLHVACALVLFGIVRRTLAREKVSLPSGLTASGTATAVALLWAVHPLNTEAVAYVTQRTESMMALFALLTLYGSLRALESSRAALWQKIAIGACALGMTCKETMVVAPVLVWLFDRVFVFDSFKDAWLARRRFYGWLAATWLVLAVVVLSTPRTFGAGFSSTDPSVWHYLLNQTAMISRYLWLTVWPHALVLFYGWSMPTSLAAVWPYALFVTALALLTLAGFTRRPALAFLGAWFFLVLAPTSSVAPIAGEVGAERRMYRALPALVTLAVVAGAWLWSRTAVRWPQAAHWRRAAGLTTLAVVVVALGAATIARTRDYSSALTMARTVYERWPSGSGAHMLGTELRAAGRHDEAIKYLREGSATYPPSRFVLAVQLSEAGRIDEAIAEFRTFIRDEPRLSSARDAERLIVQALNGRERWQESIAMLKDILERSPGRSDALALLADTYFAKGDHAAAIPVYKTFLSLNPGHPDALANLGIAFAATGRPGEAVDAFRGVLEVRHNDPMACLNLARALLDRGDPADVPEAMRLAQHGVAMMPSVAAAYELLGRASERSGDRAGARTAFERALIVDPCYEPARAGLLRVRGR